MAGRLTSEVFVSAIIRRVNGAGGFAAVVRRGSSEAGAIFICVPGARGEGVTLYGPAPQSAFGDDDRPTIGGRLFELLGEGLSQEEIDGRLEREARIDPDFWVVELELFGRTADQFFDTI